jgi:hypothetical protein
MNRDNGVPSIVLAGKQGAGLDAIHHLPKRIDLAAQVRGHVLALAAQLEIRLYVLRAARQVFIGRKNPFEPLPLAHDLLGFSWVRPQIRIGSFFFRFR